MNAARSTTDLIVRPVTAQACVIAAPKGTSDGTGESEDSARAWDGNRASEAESHGCEDDSPSPSEFPRPHVLDNAKTFEWIVEEEPREMYPALGKHLAEAGDLYRSAEYGGGLLLASPTPSVPPLKVTSAAQLGIVLTDRVRVAVMKAGKLKGSSIPSGERATMLGSELFLQAFRTIDTVTRTPLYLDDFTLVKPGYNDGGRGQGIFYIGEPVQISDSVDTINRFLNAMSFASNADRTNAVGAALVVRLRNHWPGGKPVIPVTGNKSHSCKGTTVDFIAGRHRVTGITYESTDWAMKRQFVGAVVRNPDTAMVHVDNARLERGNSFIASGFLEAFVTDPQPLLFSTGTGPASYRRNNIVVAVTTNFGTLSNDLLNQSLPIHLELKGNIEDRPSPIGNPRHEFLPANVDRIEAELHGMIARWRTAGSPTDLRVRHPFGPCMQTIGGILEVNGFTDFLANYGMRKSADDPIRKALGILGGAKADKPMTAAGWASLVRDLGLVKTLIPIADRDSDAGHCRGIGVVLSAHEDETFHAETDDERLVLRLHRARRRFEQKAPSTRYWFEVIERSALPADDDSGS